MFSNGFVCYCHSAFKYPNPYHGGENLKQVVLRKRSLSTSLGHKNLGDDDHFQREKSSYCIQASESFLNWHFSKIFTCNDQQWESVTCRDQFAVQNRTLKPYLSSFLSFEPSFYCQMLSHSLAHILQVLP